MPELPEVETTKRGIEPHVVGHGVARCLVYEARLRWPVPPDLPRLLRGRTILGVRRRAKYLLLQFTHGWLIVHLGMSGSLRITPTDSSRLKHDHIELLLDNGNCLRYCDPRRFGAWLWTTSDPQTHPLLAHLGPEPLTRQFSPRYLYRSSRNIRQPVKTFIMHNPVVVGVGNIYANEALFIAGILPCRAAGSLELTECAALVSAIKRILTQAIKRGGTTLRDFVGGDGKPGYFAQELMVYGREGQTCRLCRQLLIQQRIGQRSTVYCSRCQR